MGFLYVGLGGIISPVIPVRKEKWLKMCMHLLYKWGDCDIITQMCKIQYLQIS